MSRAAAFLAFSLLALGAASPCGAQERDLVYPGATPLPQPEERTFALVVGVSEYLHGAGGGVGRGGAQVISDLEYADADAYAFGEFLETPMAGALEALHWQRTGGRLLVEGDEHGGYVRLLNDEATAANIQAALSWLAEQAGSRDHVVIYMAGHGTLDGGVGWFLPHEIQWRGVVPEAVLDAEQRSDLSGAVSLDLTGIGAGQLDVFLDVCSARALPVVGPWQQAYLLSATQNRGLAEESNFYADRYTLLEEGAFRIPGDGHGLFTLLVLEALRGQADSNGDGRVSRDEVSFFLGNEIQRFKVAPQLPGVAGSFDGRGALSREAEGWVPATASTLSEDARERLDTRRRALAWSAGGSALAAVALVGTAAVIGQRYPDADPDHGQLLYDLNHAAVIGASVAGLTSVGLGLGAVTVRFGRAGGGAEPGGSPGDGGAAGWRR